MSLSSVFNIAGSGMSAQSTRLNTISSNIANAETVSSSVDQTYRARHPVFATVFQQAGGQPNESLFAGQDQALEVERRPSIAPRSTGAPCAAGAAGTAPASARAPPPHDLPESQALPFSTASIAAIGTLDQLERGRVALEPVSTSTEG